MYIKISILYHVFAKKKKKNKEITLHKINILNLIRLIKFINLI